MVLVGNKSDMIDQRAISTEQAHQLATSLGFKYFETSAKDNINVSQTFDSLVDEISEKMVESIEKNPNFNRRRNEESLENSGKERTSTSSGCSC